MPAVVGVDGTRDGWLAIGLTDDGKLFGEVVPSFSGLMEQRPEAKVVAVDIPVGTPQPDDYPRAADSHARKMIQQLRSSVFAVPPREALAAPSYREANAVCRRYGLPGISQQAWALGPKILEVEPYASDLRVYEIHPEVSFAAMAGQALAYSKRTWLGYLERLALLKAESMDPRNVQGDLGRASVDDVLDAMAAVWSALRIADGTASSLPPGVDLASPAIWY